MSLRRPHSAAVRTDIACGLNLLTGTVLIWSAICVQVSRGESPGADVPPPYQQAPDANPWRPPYQRAPSNSPIRPTAASTSDTRSGQQWIGGVRRASYQQVSRPAAAEENNGPQAGRAPTTPGGGMPARRGGEMPGGDASPYYLDDDPQYPEGFAWPAFGNGAGDGGCGQPCCGQPCCGQPCCGDCVNDRSNQGCGFEFSAAYLVWWGKGDETPPLVTTSPQGTARADAGVLGQPDTSILFGDEKLNNEVRSGFYGTADYWFSCDRCSGIEANYLFLGQHEEQFDRTSDGDPILARPFFNTETALQDSGLIAFPAVQTGSIDIREDTDLQGGGVLWRNNCCRNCRNRIDLLVGVRFLQLRDDLRIDETQTSIDPNGPVPVGTELDLTDKFDTRNTFHGADVGFTTQWRNCGWSFDTLLKLGIGSTQSRVSIDGSTSITEPNQTPADYSGGLLALDSNIGEYKRSNFTMVPEVGATIGYDLTCRLRVTAGYNLIYWSKVARPGDQIDMNINPTEFPPPTPTGTPAPVFRFVTNDYWVQGVNIAANYRF